MATPKDVTINDVTLGRLYINPLDENNDLLIQRDYKFSGTDPLLDQIGTQVFSVTIAFATVPQNIKDALIKINTWTYNQILAQEGMT